MQQLTLTNCATTAPRAGAKRPRRQRPTYPVAWPAIARNVKELAGWCCEHCGHPHDPQNGYTLTVHHLDMNPDNCAYANLVALCQRCHLSIQSRYIPGQQWLTNPPTWAIKRGLVVKN